MGRAHYSPPACPSCRGQGHSSGGRVGPAPELREGKEGTREGHEGTRVGSSAAQQGVLASHLE